MSSTFNLYVKLTAFDDPDRTNAPKLKAFDWNRATISGVPVDNPDDPKCTLPPYGSKTIFDGTVQLGYDATSEFGITLSSLGPNRYRFTWSDGKDPEFRQARALDLVGGSLTLTMLANQSVAVTHSDGAVFGSVTVGDEIFIPGVTTGDTSLFLPLNEGKWFVLGASTTQLTIVRETGTVFEGYTETKAITSALQFQVFSSSGVQVGNTLAILSGFATALRHNYEIKRVTATFLEFESSAPLPLETLTPGANSFYIYSSAKSFYYLETDQEIDVSINGNVAETITPFQAGDPSYPGIKMASGVVYSLEVTNRAGQSASVRILTVE